MKISQNLFNVVMYISFFLAENELYTRPTEQRIFLIPVLGGRAPSALL